MLTGLFGDGEYPSFEGEHYRHRRALDGTPAPAHAGRAAAHHRRRLEADAAVRGEARLDRRREPVHPLGRHRRRRRPRRPCRPHRPEGRVGEGRARATGFDPTSRSTRGWPSAAITDERATAVGAVVARRAVRSSTRSRSACQALDGPGAGIGRPRTRSRSCLRASGRDRWGFSYLVVPGASATDPGAGRRPARRELSRPTEPGRDPGHVKAHALSCPHVSDPRLWSHHHR